jgi:hypothetical protein
MSAIEIDVFFAAWKYYCKGVPGWRPLTAIQDLRLENKDESLGELWI